MEPKSIFLETFRDAGFEYQFWSILVSNLTPFWEARTLNPYAQGQCLLKVGRFWTKLVFGSILSSILAPFWRQKRSKMTQKSDPKNSSFSNTVLEYFKTHLWPILAPLGYTFGHQNRSFCPPGVHLGLLASKTGPGPPLGLHFDHFLITFWQLLEVI